MSGTSSPDHQSRLVEVNPILDRENRTAATLVVMTASLLGKKIF